MGTRITSLSLAMLFVGLSSIHNSSKFFSLTVTDKRPPKDWPSQGELVFDDVSLLYAADATPVLKNLCFKINPKDKVGRRQSEE